MTVFDLDPTLRWMFCLTHPDDEISIAAFIRQLVDNGNEVWLSWTHRTEVREAEARRVAEVLGISADRLVFHEGTDGLICEELEALKPGFARMFSHAKPDRVVCGAFEQGHLDHDATNWLVCNTFEGPIFEVPFYHTYCTRAQSINRFSDPAEQSSLLLNEQDQLFKRNIAKMYPSQNIWMLLVLHEVWTAVRFRRVFLFRRELMRLKTNYNFETPHHPPSLAARVSKSKSWARWLRAMERVK